MKRRKNGVNVTYNRNKKNSDYRVHPLQSGGDPEVRVAAMTVMNYFKENQDKLQVPKGDEQQVKDMVYHTDEYENGEKQNMDAAMNMFKSEQESEGNSFLPIAANVKGLAGQFKNRTEKLVETFKGFDPEADAPIVMMLEYSEAAYDYVVDVLRLMQNSEDMEAMGCCLLVYLRMMGIRKNSIDVDINTAEDLEKIKEALKKWKKVLQTASSFFDLLNSLANSLMKIIRSAMMMATYALLDAVREIYNDLTEGVREWITDAMGNVGISMCSDDVVNILSTSDFESTDEVMSYISMILSSNPDIKGADAQEKVSALFDFLKSTNDNVSDIEGELNRRIQSILGDKKLTQQDICGTCLPFYRMTKEIVVKSFDNLDATVLNLMDKCLASIPSLPSLPRESVLLRYSKLLIKIIDKILELDLEGFHVTMNQCTKRFGGVRDISEAPAGDLESPATGETDERQTGNKPIKDNDYEIGNLFGVDIDSQTPKEETTGNITERLPLPPEIEAELGVPTNISEIVERSITDLGGMLPELEELYKTLGSSDLEGLINALLQSTDGDLGSLLELLGLDPNASTQEILMALYDFLKRVGDRHVGDKSRILRLSDRIDEIINTF